MKVVRKAIVLRKQELSVWIGVHDHEKSARQRLLVSVEVDVEGQADENDTLADAILDRLVHNAYRIDLTGESMRKQRSPRASETAQA